jgi:hypothetical protein
VSHCDVRHACCDTRHIMSCVVIYVTRVVICVTLCQKLGTPDICILIFAFLILPRITRPLWNPAPYPTTPLSYIQKLGYSGIPSTILHLETRILWHTLQYLEDIKIGGHSNIEQPPLGEGLCHLLYFYCWHLL